MPISINALYKIPWSVSWYTLRDDGVKTFVVAKVPSSGCKGSFTIYVLEESKTFPSVT